jgi:hypothetical protein
MKSCKDCVAPKRHLGCHAHCPDYIEEKKENELRREKIYKAKSKVYELENLEICAKERAMRKRSKKFK